MAFCLFFDIIVELRDVVLVMNLIVNRGCDISCIVLDLRDLNFYLQFTFLTTFFIILLSDLIQLILLFLLIS